MANKTSSVVSLIKPISQSQWRCVVRCLFAFVSHKWYRNQWIGRWPQTNNATIHREQKFNLINKHKTVQLSPKTKREPARRKKRNERTIGKRERERKIQRKKKKLNKFTYDLANNVISNEKMRSNLRRSNGCLEQQQQRNSSGDSRNNRKKNAENKIDNYWLYIAVAIKCMNFLNSRP